MEVTSQNKDTLDYQLRHIIKDGVSTQIMISMFQIFSRIQK